MIHHRLPDYGDIHRERYRPRVIKSEIYSSYQVAKLVLKVMTYTFRTYVERVQGRYWRTSSMNTSPNQCDDVAESG